METISIKLIRTLKASPQLVFSALTEKKFISLWCKRKGSVQSRINGSFEMFDGWVKGKVLEYEPGKKLSYTWKPCDWNESWKETIVKYVFHSQGDETYLELVHSGFPTKEEAQKHEKRWIELVFEPLNNFLSLTRTA